MKVYIVRYEKTYSARIEAETEEEALRKAEGEDFALDEVSEYEAEEE